MRFFLSFVALVLWLSSGLVAQQPLSLETILKTSELSPKSAGSFSFLKDGRHYTRLEQNAIIRYDILKGNKLETIYEGGSDLRIQTYEFSADERYILIGTDRISLYRHSYQANFMVWDRTEEKLYPVSEGGKQMYATFSPDGRQVAFVRDNNLFVANYALGKEIQITQDGQKNAIINGGSDWVYEEEFTLVRAFEWSPDGTRLAFWRFDETEVPEFTMTLYHDELYPTYETFKYPKVGEKNARVQILVHDLAGGATTTLPTEVAADHYIPRIQWTRDPNQLCVTRLNRHQNHLELLLFDLNSNTHRTILEEKNKYYIDIHDNLHFLDNGKQFVWTSESSGYNHIYLYELAGGKPKPLTEGAWEVTDFYGLDEANGKFYFQAAKQSPLEREVYEGNLKNTQPKLLRGGEGVTSAKFSSTFDYLVTSQSTANTPAIHAIYKRDGSLVRMIEDNSALIKKQQDYGVQPLEFFNFKTSENVALNGWMIKPPNFNPEEKYPVFMFLYGGPGSQQAIDSWRGQNYWWFQMLAQQGFIIACVDNRGTGARGEEFKKMTYLQLGHYETIDQIEAAQYLGALPYTDANRIGIFGWSYGGYMSTLCLLKGNDVFKAAIAVAPVTNWKWYDSIYTERFMRTASENPKGYKENSPVYFADRLKGDYLLIHGMADDNVHFQNTVEMANALIEADKQFETYYYPNRNHGIGGGNARFHLYTKMTQFIHRSLGSKS